MNSKNKKIATLKRPLQTMPAFVRKALVKEKLIDDYQNRPPYQRNDYLLWIISAKLEETKQKRLRQMLDELQQGNRYMKMSWRVGSKNRW